MVALWFFGGLAVFYGVIALLAFIDIKLRQRGFWTVEQRNRFLAWTGTILGILGAFWLGGPASGIVSIIAVVAFNLGKSMGADEAARDIMKHYTLVKKEVQ